MFSNPVSKSLYKYTSQSEPSNPAIGDTWTELSETGNIIQRWVRYDGIWVTEQVYLQSAIAFNNANGLMFDLPYAASTFNGMYVETLAVNCVHTIAHSLTIYKTVTVGQCKQPNGASSTTIASFNTKTHTTALQQYSTVFYLNKTVLFTDAVYFRFISASTGTVGNTAWSVCMGYRGIR